MTAFGACHHPGNERARETPRREFGVGGTPPGSVRGPFFCGNRIYPGEGNASGGGVRPPGVGALHPPRKISPVFSLPLPRAKAFSRLAGLARRAAEERRAGEVFGFLFPVNFL